MTDIRRFVDSNVLIYAFDKTSGEKRKKALALLNDLWMDRSGCISIQVMQEFYAATVRKSIIDREKAMQILHQYLDWSIHSPKPEDVIGAIIIQNRYQISFWDAMILNSAMEMDCATVYSEDLNDGQFYGSVQIVNPFRQTA